MKQAIPPQRLAVVLRHSAPSHIHRAQLRLSLGVSLFGAQISSITFVAYPADAFKTAWLRYLICLTLPVSVFIAARYLLPFFRRGNVTSLFEYLEAGHSLDVFLDQFPSVRREQAVAALELAREVIAPDAHPA